MVKKKIQKKTIGSPLRLRASPYGASPVSPGRLHLSRDILDDRSVLHNLDVSLRTSVATRVTRTAQGRLPVVRSGRGEEER